ncbi:MAG: vitamin K epoxide reductase family protein [Leptolyngbyaceae cyanobacterium bins.302]|nr:vitamin K epoxide reductase family protein [Leptolyngbyaceae cyanobacterium bins.302]
MNLRLKRPVPRIYRWSRPLMAGIASLGAVTTAYLAIAKFTENPTICPTKGCDTVLSSPYANVFGLPLALFGFLGYLSMILLAIAPLLVPADKKELRSRLDQWTGLLLFVGGTAMMLFSGYLMYLLAFEIKAVCIYCVASAIFSTSLFVLAIVGRDWQDIGQLLFTGAIVGMVVLIGTLGLYSSVKNPVADQVTPGGYAITTSSGAAEIALAEHLTQIGAKMYGAYTCPHCHNQKQLFGKEAVQKLNYVECHPDGQNARPDLCDAAKIEGFPTWEINGKFFQGEKSLQELADLSTYKGLRNFKNTPNSGH